MNSAIILSRDVCRSFSYVFENLAWGLKFQLSSFSFPFPPVWRCMTTWHECQILLHLSMKHWFLFPCHHLSAHPATHEHLCFNCQVNSEVQAGTEQSWAEKAHFHSSLSLHIPSLEVPGWRTACSKIISTRERKDRSLVWIIWLNANVNRLNALTTQSTRWSPARAWTGLLAAFHGTLTRQPSARSSPPWPWMSVQY